MLDMQQIKAMEITLLAGAASEFALTRDTGEPAICKRNSQNLKVCCAYQLSSASLTVLRQAKLVGIPAVVKNSGQSSVS